MKGHDKPVGEELTVSIATDLPVCCADAACGIGEGPGSAPALQGALC